jgi:hypothetical protein
MVHHGVAEARAHVVTSGAPCSPKVTHLRYAVENKRGR